MEKEENKKNNYEPPMPDLPIELPEKPKNEVTPQIRPVIKQKLDTIIPVLTNVELAYAWRLIKQTTLSRVAQTQQPNQQVEHIDPVLQPVLDDIKMAEQYVTRNFTVRYPPKKLVPISGNESSGFEDLLEMIFNRIDPILRSPKVQNEVARLIGALADKLEGKP